MQIHLTGDDRIRLTGAGSALTIESTGEHALSPFHLLAASLATCTWAVLRSYGEHARIPLDDLAIEVAWEMGGEPYRVTGLRMAIDWPGLPPARREAARRAAAHCTVHHTLEHGSSVETVVSPSYSKEEEQQP